MVIEVFVEEVVALVGVVIGVDVVGRVDVVVVVDGDVVEVELLENILDD